MSQPDGARLNSWKEIAAHLGRDARTVRRWELERGMPVHRVPGGHGGSVFAYVSELDAWLLKDGAPDAAPAPGGDPEPALAPASPAGARRRILPVLLVAAAILFAVVSAWQLGWFQVTAPAIHALALDRGELRGLDDDHGVRWTYRFEQPGVTHAPIRWTFVGEPDRQGHQLIVANLEVPATSPGGSAGALYAFDETGRLRWKRVADERFHFASGEYGPPWPSQSDLLAFEADGERRFAWALHHDTWWPSFVVVLDAEGRTRGRFVNAGWIRRMAMSADGRFLCAAGISNAAQAPMVAILDIAHLSGSSPEEEGSRYTCLDCPAGRPYRYFVFPRSPVSVAMQMRLDAPRVTPLGEDLEVRVVENEDPVATAETIFEFSPALELRRAARNDIYWEWRRRLEAAHALTPPRAGDPDGDVPVVRAWDPARGWQELRGTPPPMPPTSSKRVP